MMDKTVPILAYTEMFTHSDEHPDHGSAFVYPGYYRELLFLQL